MELKLKQRNGVWMAVVTIAEYEDTKEYDRIYDKYEVDAALTLYRSIDKFGIAKYMSHVRFNECGYGGKVFTLQVRDGEGFENYHLEQIKGPWSSRASVMNVFFTPHIVDVEIHTPTTCETRGITVETLEPLLHAQGAELVKVTYGNGEIIYTIQPIKVTT